MRVPSYKFISGFLAAGLVLTGSAGAARVTPRAQGFGGQAVAPAPHWVVGSDEVDDGRGTYRYGVHFAAK